MRAIVSAFQGQNFEVLAAAVLLVRSTLSWQGRFQEVLREDHSDPYEPAFGQRTTEKERLDGDAARPAEEADADGGRCFSFLLVERNGNLQ